MDTYKMHKEIIGHQEGACAVSQHETVQPALKSGWQMFYLLPIAYAIAPYLFCVALFNSGEEGNVFWAVLTVLPLILGIGNIIASVRMCKPENRLVLLNASVIIKYALIPFYILGGGVILIALLFSFIPVPFMIFAGPMMAFFLGCIGWLILAMGSSYVISYLRLSKKAELRPTVVAVIHGIIQFFFTVDVIDVMFLAIRERKWIKTTIAIILGVVIAVVAFIIWLIVALAGM